MLERVQRLVPIAERLGITMAQLALAWVLREENVASAIVGASRPEQVHDNASASGIELDAETLAEIDRRDHLGSGRWPAASSARRTRSSSAAAPSRRSCGRRSGACPPTIPPSSTPSGAARASARCSGRCSSRSSRPTTAFDADAVARGRRSRTRACATPRRSSSSASRRGSGTGGRARPSLQAAGDVELPERYRHFDQLIAATAMRGFEQGLLPAPMRGDFRAYGKVYRHLAPEQHAEAHSIAARAPARAELAVRASASRGTTSPSTPEYWSLYCLAGMERIDRYADLIVRVGANVQQGQTLFVTALVEHAPLARALARAGYRAGARLVDVRYADNHLRRAFIESRPRTTLTESPPWLLARAEAIAAGGALIMIGGDPEPELLADLDQARVGKARPVDAMKRAAARPERADGQLDDRRVTRRRARRAGLRRARRRAALGGGRSSRSASTRPTPSQAWHEHVRAAARAVRAARRAALRRDPLQRARAPT